MWYWVGSVAEPPPTSMYFCFGDPRLAPIVIALSRASSSDNSRVGVEMASDFGRARPDGSTDTAPAWDTQACPRTHVHACMHVSHTVYRIYVQIHEISSTGNTAPVLDHKRKQMIHLIKLSLHQIHSLKATTFQHIVL